MNSFDMKTGPGIRKTWCLAKYSYPNQALAWCPFTGGECR